MPKQEHLNIAIVPNIAGASGRDHLSGVLKYINTGKRWSPQILNTPDELLHLCSGRRRPNGIVTITPPDALDRLLAFGIPTVVTDHPPAIHDKLPPHVSFVRPDDEFIGAAAARHFLSRAAFNSFAVVIDEPNFLYARARERGFRNELATSNHYVKTFVLDDENTNDRLHETFLRTLARLLSSILPDHVGIGFRAAQELDRLLHGKPGTSIVLPNSVKDLILRDSTRIVPPTGRLVQAALSFIEANAARNLRVGDVVRHLGVSRRLADLRFRQIQHESILETISRARLRLVKKRLLTTRDSLAHIAADCGFRSGAALARFFARETGMTMTAWRRK